MMMMNALAQCVRAGETEEVLVQLDLQNSGLICAQDTTLSKLGHYAGVDRDSPRADRDHNLI